MQEQSHRPSGRQLVHSERLRLALESRRHSAALGPPITDQERLPIVLGVVDDTKGVPGRGVRDKNNIGQRDDRAAT